MALMFYNVNDLKSFFEMYFLIKKNKAISIKIFLFKLILNLIIERKST